MKRRLPPGDGEAFYGGSLDPGTPSRGPKRFAAANPLRFRIALFIFALVLALGIGTGVGAFIASPDPQPYESEPQTTVLSSQGKPDQWLLADGPVKPGGEIHRVETWVYGDGDSARYYKWIDGVLIEEGSSDAHPYARDPALPAPDRLHHGMDIADVIEILGESPEYIPFDDAPFEFSLAYLFEQAQLVVTFYDDKLLTAQTW